MDTHLNDELIQYETELIDSINSLITDDGEIDKYLVWLELCSYIKNINHLICGYFKTDMTELSITFDFIYAIHDKSHPFNTVKQILDDCDILFEKKFLGTSVVKMTLI